MSVLLVSLFEETVGAQDHLALAVSSKRVSQSQSTYLGAYVRSTKYYNPLNRQGTTRLCRKRI